MFGEKTLAIEAKWLPQTQVENTRKGNFIWVKVALIFRTQREREAVELWGDGLRLQE